MARTLGEDELLTLADALAGGGWVSGAQLAAAAGISREALSKRVQKLAAEWQLEVESGPGRGYRLTHPLQRLVATTLRALLPTLWQDMLKVDVVPRIDSTNSALLARSAADDPQVLLTEMQTAGRGRRGRQWVSPFAANLYLSLAWSFPAWPPQLTTLPLAIGVACTRSLRALGAVDVGLKWPNDLYANGNKLGGILVEQRGEATGTCRVIIGVGLNVAMENIQAGGVTQPWTTLESVLASTALPERNTLAAALVTALANACQHFAATGFASFASDWNTFDLTLGQTVTVLEGDARWHGIAQGVGADGALRVATPEGVRPVRAADVSLRIDPS